MITPTETGDVFGPLEAPPLSNRGCLDPKSTETGDTEPVLMVDPAWGRIDWIRITVHCPIESIPGHYEHDEGSHWSGVVVGLVEHALASDIGALCGWDGAWHQPSKVGKPSQCRMVMEAVPGLQVFDFGDEFAQIQLTGSLCQAIGNMGVYRLLRTLEASDYRWVGRRVDSAWDGFPASVFVVDEALRAGRVFSRSKIAPKLITDSEGRQTVYTGPRSSSKLARFYDLRGPVRAEFQFNDDAADALLHFLASHEPDEWPQLLLDAFCGFIDFADGERASRSDRLTWWADFCSDSQGLRLAKPYRDPVPALPVGQLDGMICRNRIKLAAAVDAYGEQWLLGRIRRWINQREDHATVKEHARKLTAFRGSGLCGVPDQADDIPI